MKSKRFLIMSFLLTMTVTLAANPQSLKKTGIGFRGSYWDMKISSPGVFVEHSHFNDTHVRAGGGGGWLFVFSRISPRDFVEFSIGGAGNAETTDNWFDKEEVKVEAVTPLLVGIRHDLLSAPGRSDLYPYVSAGLGPYWAHHVIAVEQYGYDDDYETVETTSKFLAGGYFGGGMNIMLTSWMGLNLDGRYHIVDFNANHEYSGFELGIGMIFMWGEW